jgi:hypothetical protein
LNKKFREELERHGIEKFEDIYGNILEGIYEVAEKGLRNQKGRSHSKL